MSKCKHQNCQRKVFKKSDACILHTPKNDWFFIETDFFKQQNWDNSKKNIRRFWIEVFKDIKKADTIKVYFNDIHFPKISYEDVFEVFERFIPDKKHLFQKENIFFPMTFENCTFEGEVAFWYFKFKNTIKIKNCTFYKFCVEGSTFRKDLIIENTHFNKYFNLCRVQTKSKITINKISMHKKCNLDFHGIYKSNVYFSDIVFNTSLKRFSNATKSSIEFNNVEFKKLTDITSWDSTFTFNYCQFHNETTFNAKGCNIFINDGCEEEKQEKYRTKINHTFYIHGNVKELVLNNIDVYGILDLMITECDELIISNTTSYPNSIINLNNTFTNKETVIDTFIIYNSNFMDKLKLSKLKINKELLMSNINTEIMELFKLDLSSTENIQISDNSIGNAKINHLELGKIRNDNFELIDTSFIRDVKYYLEKQMDFKEADEFYKLEMRKYEFETKVLSKKIILSTFRHLSTYGQNWITPLFLFIFISFLFYLIDMDFSLNKDFITNNILNKKFISNIIVYSNPLNLKPIIKDFTINSYSLFYLYKLISFLLIYQIFIAIKRIVRRR